jgi:hypothetical protein
VVSKNDILETMNKEELLSKLNVALRNLKIDNITSEHKMFSVFNPHTLPYKMLHAIVQFSSEYRGVLVGSCLLRGYGLISRNPHDIDMLISQDIFEEIKKEYKIRRPTYMDELDTNCIGYITYNQCDIDLFIDERHSEITKSENGILVDSIMPTIQKKIEFLNYGRVNDIHKDMDDFLHMIYSINNVEDF